MELLILFILTLLNGFFALSEIALVSANKSRIENLASKNDKRAKTVLKLLENPENFLSSVQVGITLIGIIAGAYGGATLSGDLAEVLNNIPWLAEYATGLSLVIVIGGITYFTIVIGELVPKTIAMNNADRIALFCVPIIRYFTLITYPFVKLLSFSTKVVLKLFGIKESNDQGISEEELRFMLKTAGKQGILETEESQAHQNLFTFTDLTASTLMTHRSDLEWIDYNSGKEEVFRKMSESFHSKFPICDDTLDNIKGIITVKSFLENYKRPDFKFEDIIRPPIYITQNTPAFRILQEFKINKEYIGIVVDEYGVTKGILTLHDLFEAIVGDLPEEDEAEEDDNIIPREDGTYLIDGKTPIYEINQYFQHELIEEDNSYSSISGLILNNIASIPNTGDQITVDNLHFEIVDMDGIRIDKIMMKIEEADNENHEDNSESTNQ
ncbi:HlyC/CorC family transporter [Candidatus Peregrinibacteria bacterium HGW-Peregrinibacteria-1]|jgi:putative hemolysin|nr:MAG: HlyC/CorC family transporter [Candidatus Peregrinibacteria bacterium HGW-Peregrinibacteria-1]